MNDTNAQMQVLDVDTLQEWVQCSIPQGYDVDNEDYGALLDNLNQFGINAVPELQALFDAHYEAVATENDRIVAHVRSLHERNDSVQQFEGYYIEEEDLDRTLGGYFFTMVGFVREMLNKKLDRPWYE